MACLPSDDRAAIPGKPLAARIYARWPHAGAGWPVLAAALLMAVTGFGFAWSAAECDDGARE
jgi:hypothetical protein